MARTDDSNNRLVKEIHELVIKMSQNMEKTQIADYVQLMNKPRKLFFLNIWAGVARGIGIALGFTFFATTILFVLRGLGALDLPIIGSYIAEIVKVVQNQLEGRRF